MLQVVLRWDQVFITSEDHSDVLKLVDYCAAVGIKLTSVSIAAITRALNPFYVSNLLFKGEPVV